MKFCKRAAVVTRRLTMKNFRRPSSIKSVIKVASIKTFPVIVDTVVNNNDLIASALNVAELEVAVLSLQIAMVLISMSIKNMSKNDLKSD
jgi:hypothetical protein